MVALRRSGGKECDAPSATWCGVGASATDRYRRCDLLLGLDGVEVVAAHRQGHRGVALRAHHDRRASPAAGGIVVDAVAGGQAAAGGPGWRRGPVDGVANLGVDEHVWRHTPHKAATKGPGMLTGMVDLTRDADGRVHARLLDLVPGRTGKAYAT